MGETVFAIVALGLPGFFTYVVLVKRNILIYTKDHADEKVMLIGLLSLTNIAVILLILESFNLEVMSIAGFLIIVGITLLLTFWFYPFVIRNGRRMLEDHLEKTGQKNRSNIPFMDRIHDEKPAAARYIQCVFFDFNHCFVESGYLKYYSYSENGFILYPDGQSNLDYAKFKKRFEALDPSEASQMMDFDKEMIIYFIYYPNSNPDPLPASHH
ncbi:hypothetical protein [Salinicoccus roseus]|uniref:hypothetical protein n=1 Tax=Salinicoccus roseus TaxID=45670 RepID=UPI002300AAA3|nr:hypothetical protein [Salinicoccus roseus]